ncbi:MAG: YggS family pyridoxal phosphate-dependent enzyme [Xylophilus ampelinus]
MTTNEHPGAELAERLGAVQGRLAAAAGAAGRPAPRLLAVSKTQCAGAVRAAHAAGQRAFGENYVQEGVEKIAALADLRAALEWHCIGPLQSNKTRPVAEHFDWVQSVDRLKLAERLSAQRPDDRAPLNVCLQVNIDGSPSKSGVPPQEARALAEAVHSLPRLRLRGLMTIPDPAPDGGPPHEAHRRARALFDELVAAGLPLDTLSMGMSDDLDAAVAAGSTMVRVGSAIFGARPARG